MPTQDSGLINSEIELMPDEKTERPGEYRLDINDLTQAQNATEITQVSTNHDGQTNIPPTVLLGLTQDDQILLAELNREENDVNNAQEARDDQESSSSSSQVKIQKVPEILRENGKINRYFTPRMISIGPIHASDPELSRRELKVKLTKKFIKNNGLKPESLLRNIKRKIHNIRMCFGEGVIPGCYNDDSLARLLLLDGCAVLQFIDSYLERHLNEFKISNIEAALIAQDLFLFENQIPFAVLKLLLDLIGKKEKQVREKGGYPFASYQHVCFSIIYFTFKNSICAETKFWHIYDDFHVRTFDKKMPVHLLDLLWEVSTFGAVDGVKIFDDNTIGLVLFFRYLKKSLSSALGCLCKPKPTENSWGRQSFRNVEELKSSGIKMKLSKSRSLKSVSFSTHCFGVRGHLSLPALDVDESTICKLCNLVAHEMCQENNKNQSVTSYINFLDLLIDTEQDVKDLRAAKILRNHLSTDEEVAQLINMIGGSLFFSRDLDDYKDTKNKIEEHYKRRCVIWIAQAYDEHFRNPWTIVALFAAALALILTFVQTWYAIHPKE